MPTELYRNEAHQSFTRLSADGNLSSLLISVVPFGNFIYEVPLKIRATKKRIRATGASGPKSASAILTLMNYVLFVIGNQIKYTIA